MAIVYRVDCDCQATFQAIILAGPEQHRDTYTGELWCHGDR